MKHVKNMLIALLERVAETAEDAELDYLSYIVESVGDVKTMRELETIAEEFNLR